MKKAILLAAAVGLLLTAAWIWGQGSEASPASFSEICSTDAAGVEKLLIRDGFTGEARSSVDSGHVEMLFDVFGEREFRQADGSEHTVGWVLYVDLYSSENRYVRVSFHGLAVKRVDMADGVQQGRAQFFEMDDDSEVIDQLLELYRSLPEDQGV